MSGGVAFYQDWDLEGSGNWTRFDDNARVETQNHTDFNEINQRTVSSQNATPTHDKNGNMTDTGFSVVGGQNFPGGKRRLEFDALNRVRKVYDNNNTTTTSDDTLLAEYIYDCGNRRLQKVVTNSGSLNGTTRFYYLGWRVMEERDGSDAILQQYVYGNYLDEVWTRDDRRSSITVAQLNDGTGTHRVFCHANTLYSVHGITDEAGALVEAYQFDAYGKQTVITDGNDGDTIVNFNANDVRTAGGNSTFTNPYMFTGQRFDPETGIMYYKMRYYSFDLGRFMSRDPIGGLWLYEYCGDNTTGYLDPMGLQLGNAEQARQVAAKNGVDVNKPPQPVAQAVEKASEALSQPVPTNTGRADTTESVSIIIVSPGSGMGMFGHAFLSVGEHAFGYGKKGPCKTGTGISGDVYKHRLIEIYTDDENRTVTEYVLKSKADVLDVTIAGDALAGDVFYDVTTLVGDNCVTYVTKTLMKANVIPVTSDAGSPGGLQEWLETGAGAQLVRKKTVHMSKHDRWVADVTWKDNPKYKNDSNYEWWSVCDMMYIYGGSSEDYTQRLAETFRRFELEYGPKATGRWLPK